ncbi:MAG: fructosamine kinase family protein, partial [Chromatiaceae bacterium]
AEAGRRLAHLHRQSQARFGWDRDNFIGSTPQPNAEAQDWASFWQTRRLGPQLNLALAQGFGGRLQDRGRRLGEACPALIDHSPQPSLLHGDLWSGNMAFDAAGQPVLFDPAVYYGDREADLAMTELFGGFGADFQAAYREAWPLDPGYQVRRDLYNLYHILNHLNLFGAGYLGQALGMIDRLLAVLH